MSGEGQDMDQKNHRKKMIAPVIITILFLGYLAFYLILVLVASNYSPFTLLLAIPLILLGAGMAYVLYARIKEIRSGEEDGLSNY